MCIKLYFQEKGPNSHYFLIGVNETEMKFRGIMCKGSHYPPIAPRPIMAEILIQVNNYTLLLCYSFYKKFQLRPQCVMQNHQGEN